MYSCGPDGSRRPPRRPALYLTGDLIRRNAEHRHHLVADLPGSATCGHPPTVGRSTRRAADAFRADCSALNLRPPRDSPRSSERRPGHGDCSPGRLDRGAAPGADLGRRRRSVRRWRCTSWARPSTCTRARPPHLERERAVVGRGRRARGRPALGPGRAAAVRRRGGPRPPGTPWAWTTWPAAGSTRWRCAWRSWSTSYRRAAGPRLGALAAADRTLRGGAGSSPSGRPSPSQADVRADAAQVTAAFDDDLDTPAALAVLHALAQRPGPGRARSSRRSPTPTSCSGWIWPARSAAEPALAALPGARSADRPARNRSSA